MFTIWRNSIVTMVSTSSKAKILFVVEGEVAEVSFLKSFQKYIPIDIEEEIVTYRTNIYQLYSSLFREGEGADLIRVLKNREKDEKKREVLNQPFVEVYLLFDYDLHDSQYTDTKILELMDYFDNSTENGLLLLNYPMLESYRHLKKIPDYEYRHRSVKLIDVPHYKYTVKHEGFFYDVPNQRIMYEIVRHNIDKLNYINHHRTNVFTLEADIEDELKAFLRTTIGFKNRKHLVNVMNTGSLLGYAYAPKRMSMIIKDYVNREYGDLGV